MVTAVVAIVIAGLLLALVLAVAHDPAPGPADVAFGYELAWDHFDFVSLWTLSASGVRDFRKLYGTFATIAPLRSNITIEDVGKTALYLASDLSSAVTGETIYVDGGFNVMGVPLIEG